MARRRAKESSFASQNADTGARGEAPPSRRRADVVDAAGALYLAGVRAHAPLDVTVAKFLREHHGIGDADRAFVVDSAQSMWRHRARIELAARALSFEPTRGALVSLFLVGTGSADVRDLPIDPRSDAQLRAAWATTNDAPLDVRAGVPAWLIDKLRAQDADDLDARVLSFTDAPPQALRANTLKASLQNVIGALSDEGIDSESGSIARDSVIVLGARGSAIRRANVFATRAFKDGLFEVQDEGSQLVGEFCAVKAGLCVVDGCAGAGGKTLHLAALMEGKGEIHAFDVADHRLKALRERAKRAGAHNVRVHDDVAEKKRLKERADLVLVDAPCSGTGVLRRNPDIAWKLKADDVARLVQQQSQILDGYAPLVKVGGRLVYATCSILDDENDAVVDAFLARTPSFARAEILRVDPRRGCDGFFACALVRSR